MQSVTNMLDSDEEISMATDTTPAAVLEGNRKQRNIQACNFRSAGRLSNENARALTAIYESFARHLANSLDASLGTGIEVRFKSLEQDIIKDHIAKIPQLAYVVPMSLSTLSGAMFLECGLDLIFPVIEVLLGGTGASVSNPRELSEIEEEIMQDVTALIARQCEQASHLPHMSLSPGRRIKPSALHQFCAPKEKMTVARFEVEIADTTGRFDLAIPGSFISILLNQIKQDQPQNRGRLRQFPTLSLRERIVDCYFSVAATLPQSRVTVRDLIALQPGCVLKLRAPVRGSGMLTIGGRQIFEAAPVRNGSQKAAKLGNKSLRTGTEEE